MAMLTLTEKVWLSVKRSNTPFDSMFEITRKCNLDCCHCYVVKDEQKKELTFEEITRVVDELREIGCLFLTITGGEVLLREDFFKIARYIRDKGFALQIFTNGTLITSDIADEMQKLSLLKVCMSLYSASPEVHESITKMPGSYKKTISAIKLLRERNIPVNINCTLMKQNIKEYRKVVRLVQSLGAEVHIDPVIVPMDNGDKTPLAYRMSDKDLMEIITIENSNLNCNIQNVNITPEFICDAGKTVCSISAYGDVYPCLQLPICLGNIRENSFRQIWNFSEKLLKIQKLKLDNLSSCLPCEFRNYCDRCPGLSFLEDRDISGPSSIACKIAKIRSQNEERKNRNKNKKEKAI